MLRHLYIKNFTLISELDIPFYPGFSVITGETGAGKSIILGAIALLLGNRADARQVKQGTNKCIVEAHFDLSAYDLRSRFEQMDIDYDPDDCIFRREVSANGKSRAFINDQPVTVSAMRELGNQLIDIHSQHQNLLLQKEDFQLNVVDIMAKDQGLLAEYREAYNAWKTGQRRLDALEKEIADSRTKEDFMRFQLGELEKAQLEDGEQERLEKEIDTLSHIEEIKGTLFEVSNSLTADEGGAVENVRSSAQNLQKISAIFSDVEELAHRLDSAYIELKDIAQETDSLLENIDFDPNALQQQTDRLDLLNTLEHKYNIADVAGLIEMRDQIADKISKIDSSEDTLQQQREEVTRLKQACEDVAERLTAVRREAAKQIEKEMKKRLQPLGIPNVRFAVEVSDKDLSPDGKDKACFLFSANTSTPMQPVAQVASGGEIARVMLSIKAIISSTVKLPTIIFDEIDTGVSGHVAEKMASIMKEMGNQHRQVISITHLPQIAAMGTTHYKVSKEETAEGTVSHMAILNDDQRVREIAQMLSGSSVTAAAIENAKELLK